MGIPPSNTRPFGITVTPSSRADTTKLS